MEYEKPQLNIQNVEQIIIDIFKEIPTNLTYIQQGQIATNYGFTVNDTEYFIHFNQHSMSHGFGIEKKFSEKLLISSIPVRKIVNQGIYEDYHYAITEKQEGSSLNDLSIDDFKLYLKKVLLTLFKISITDISDSHGYGWLDQEYNGMFENWESFLDFVYKEEPEELFYGKWFDLFDTTFLDKEKYEYYYSKMKSLYAYTPTYRNLIHGSYGYGNVYVHQNEVSCIINWEDASYGDYLFDLTKFIYWQSDKIQSLIIKLYIELLNQNSINTDNYMQRINCYKYYVGLDSLRFFAKTKNKENYDYVLNKLENVE